MLDITEPQEDCKVGCCQMAHIQLASSVAYIGELGETCGYGRLVDVEPLEFLFYFFFSVQESVQQAICSG